MELELILDSLDDLPKEFHPLYTEKDGKFHFTAIKGLKTQTDIDRMREGLEKERSAHKETKAKLEDFNNLSMSVDEIQEKLDRIKELEIAAADKIDDDKINEMVEARLASKLGPVERERDKFKKEAEDKDGVIQSFETKERNRTITDAVRKSATKSKIIDTAMDDVLMLAERVFDVDEDGHVITKDNVGATPGVDPEVWLTDMQSTRPHWWPASSGGGARGSGAGGGFAQNPFSHDHWNLTKQGEAVREDRTKAEQMAKAAGTTIGGAKPAAKN